MLQNIHDKAKGWVAYAIVFFISIPFALFGINSYLGGADELVAATVNGEDIPTREVQSELLQQKQRFISILGKLPPGLDDKTLKSQALEGLINRALIRQEAEKQGYRASNEEVFASIASTAAFQKDGVFDPQTYEQLLASNRRNKVEYETSLRKDLSNGQLPNGIMNTSFVPTAEAASYQALSKQVRSFDTYTLKLADYKAQVSPSEEEIKKYYDDNSARYMTEEKIKLNFVRLKVEDLLGDISVTPEALQGFYDQNANMYVTPEQRKVSHVLIKATAKAEEDKARADAIYADIKAGTFTFEDAATDSSEDTIASKNKGDMGFIARGDMGPLFEKAAFSLAKDEVSEVIKTELGYEILKVTEIKDLVQKSFDDAKVAVEADFRKEEAEKAFQEKVEKLRTLTYENDSSLDPAAQDVGIEVQTSDWFGRSGGKDFTAIPKVLTQAFDQTVYNEAKNSELIEISDTDVAVVRIESKEAAKLKPLADVSEAIKQSLIDTKTRKLVNEKGEAVLAKLKAAGNWDALADVGAKIDMVEKFAAVDRNSTKPSANVVRKAFAMNTPQADKSVFSNTILPSGDYVLISLTSVKDGDKTVDDAARDQFASALGSRERAALLAALREEAEVVIHPEKAE